MGIRDLLTLYKTLLTKENLSNFRGKTCAIDMMVWLYKGMYAVNNNPNIKDIYINFPLKMLTLLKENGINCICIFDGNLLPAKLKEIQERINCKIANEILASKLREEGNIVQSNVVINRSLNVTPVHINTLVYLLKKLNFKVIVAPYESDAQIAYLYHKNLIDFAITEDSDLIPYGVKRIAFKLNENGDFEYLNLNIEELPKNIIYNLSEEGKFMLHLTRLKLVQFCVMCGCDYIKSIKGLGMKTLIKLFKEMDSFEDIIKAVSSYGMKYRFEEQNGDSLLYLKQAKEACSVFYYQIVYDVKENKLTHIYDDFLWHYYRKKDTKDDLIEKNWITEIIENNKNKEYYGKFFDDYENYCKGELDVEKHIKEKSLESNESISKYLQIYSRFFSD
jgi:exonuclease-1